MLSHVQFTTHTPVQGHGAQADGKPKQGKGQADLSVKIHGHLPVVPDPVAAVEQQACQKLYRGNDQSAHQRPSRPGQPGLGTVQLSKQKKAASACQKHADVTASAP